MTEQMALSEIVNPVYLLIYLLSAMPSAK